MDEDNTDKNNLTFSEKLQEARHLGYTVDYHEESNSCAIRGFGIATMIDANDPSHIDSIIHPDSHKERVRQHEDSGLHDKRHR